jgi:peptidoglycan/xylan/chitin deacetylase (PgdA/CDA1 family)
MATKRVKITIMAVILIIAVLTTPAHAAHQGLNEFYYKRNSGKKIALTFDDGPHPRYTRTILKILKKYNITATFFIIGANIEYYGDVLHEIIADGHELGNHTFSHERIKDKSADEIIYEIEACNEAIYKKCGVKTNLFRPPGGIMADICISNTNILSDYNIIYWSIDTNDWAHVPPEKISSDVLKKIKSGDIILMHDYIGKNSPTPNALEIMIPELLKNGYEFVSVSELISK